MNGLESERNICADGNRGCDNLCENELSSNFCIDDLDFSIRNHAKEAFSYLIVTSMRRGFISIAKNFLYLLLGLFTSLVIAVGIGLLTIKFSSIDIPFIKDITQRYIASKVGREDITVDSAKIYFNSGSGNVVVSVKGLVIGKVKLPYLVIIPNYVQSALKGGLVISDIKFRNARFRVSSSDDMKNISFGSGNMASSRDNIFLPYKVIPDICSFIGSGIRYSISDSKVILRLGANDFILNNFRCDLDEGTFTPKRVSFSTQLAGTSQRSYFDIGISSSDLGMNFDTRIKNLKLSDISKILGNNHNVDIIAINKFLENYELPISGRMNLSFKNGKLGFGNCNLEIGKGSIRKTVPSHLVLPRSWTKIDSGQILATYQNENLAIQKMDLKIDDSGISISGINIPLSGKNNGIIDINGIIELKGVSKSNLNILPENILNACLALFEKNMSSFTLDSLKMDIIGHLNLNNKFIDNDIKISHGIFSIKNGIIPFGSDKLIKNVTAIGKISNNKTELEIFKANIDKFSVVGGNIEINTADKTSGVLKIEIPLSEFSNFSKLGRIIPFDLIEAKKPILEVNAELLNKGGLQFGSGKAVIKSIDDKQKLDISWKDNNIYAFGNLKMKSGGILALDINIDDLTNSGHKKINFNGKGDILSFYNPFLKRSCDGEISFSSNEVWKSATGTYDFKIDVKNGILNLPVIGTISGANSSLKGRANKVGNILNFTDISLTSGKNKITGKLVYDLVAEEILAFKLDNEDKESKFLKFDFYKKDNNMLLTLFADKIDISSLSYFIGKLKKGIDILASIKLDNVKINDFSKLKKLQGTLKIRDGEIINALCASILSDNSKIIFKTEEKENNIITNITASNAGTFLSDFGFMSTLLGGKLKATFVKDKLNSNICAVNCEITDIIANGNNQLSKLVSLTIPNSVQDLGANIGFNGVVFSLTINDKSVIISDGRAIGPTICISFDGNYDRIDDILSLSGVSVPVLVNNTSNKSIYAPYKLSGSLSNPIIEVNPLASSDHNVLAEIFGINLQNSSNDNYINGNKLNNLFERQGENSAASNSNEKVLNIENINTDVKNIEKSSTTIEHGIKVERLSNE